MSACMSGLGLLALTCIALGGLAYGAAPSPEELALAKRWSVEHLRRAEAAPAVPASTLASPGLVVLANHDRVLINGRPDGRRLRIAEAEYAHGLLCHAVSKVLVRLPGPGRGFSATVGVDTNAGGGSIVFAVTVGGREAFRTDVMHCGDPGIPVSLDLRGAREFTLDAGDAGDGINCDHADWAEATVTLVDGTEIRLSDLPLLAPEPEPRHGGVAPPFSFVYGGRHSDDLLPTWAFAESVERLDDQRARRVQTYTDPVTGLQVRCVIVEYADFPTVEWTVHLRNTGPADSRIVEDVQALDTSLQRGPVGEFLLRHNVGSPCQPNDYQPMETPLPPDAHERIAAAGGRPTNSDLCYVNVEWPGRGVIVALGWPGQWAAHFVRDDGDALRVVAGQELTHFRLHPGEEVRTPLVVLQFRSGGDWIRAQNVWRAWMIAHNLPRPGARPVPMHYGACFGNMQPRADEELSVIGGFLRESVPLEYWFIDAGWYPSRGDWPVTGTWEVDTERFPRGLREVADYVHANGMKFVVWFEPERVAAGTWLSEHHPEWILGGSGGGLLNLGDPEAWQWALERVDSLLTSQAIDVYRQDFNIDPLGYWRANDAEDRQGITEIKHVMGYLAFWDELLRRHPGLWIDTCASGGRRNDLETLRRSVPLLRSDYWNDPVSQQAQTMGIAEWMPYYGSGMGTSDVYWFRSCIFPASRIGWDARDPNLDYALLRRMIAECHQVQRYMMGDFYPLTACSLDNDVWAAWQFDVSESGEGVVQAFRRAECSEQTARLKLRGLEPDRLYLVTDADTDGVQEIAGRHLMQPGLLVTIPDQPGAAVITYRSR